MDNLNITWNESAAVFLSELQWPIDKTVLLQSNILIWMELGLFLKKC